MAAGATSSRGRPRRAAISSGRTRSFSACMVAWTMLIGLEDPRLLDSTSWMPAHSRTARTGPPAMTPVPAAAGRSSTTPGAASPCPGGGVGGAQQHHAGGGLPLHRVRDGLGDAWHAEEVLLRLLDALADRGRHLARLAVADADEAVAVADDHQGGEAEAPTTLHDLGDAVDRHDALEELALAAPRTAVTVGVAL